MSRIYMRFASVAAGLTVAALSFSVAATPQDKPKLGYKDTPIIPGTPYHVHDGDRPMPKIITPGTSSTQDAPGKAPSDAVVLFDGTNLDRWKIGDRAYKTRVEDGVMLVGGGGPTSKDEFGD